MNVTKASLFMLSKCVFVIQTHVWKDNMAQAINIPNAHCTAQKLLRQFFKVLFSQKGILLCVENIVLNTIQKWHENIFYDNKYVILYRF